ncbi:MAG: hypothetical protein H0T76_26040 [Nannocystis sp.]|nr:hypothetical protein [Nannocystis sp.]MBA3549954.1 hypothetical protein [Nannocystis sp.]
MTRRIPSLLIAAVAVTTLSACDASSISPPLRGAEFTGAKAPAQQEADGSLFAKWLTNRPQGGVNGLKGSGD